MKRKMNRNKRKFTKKIQAANMPNRSQMLAISRDNKENPEVLQIESPVKYNPAQKHWGDLDAQIKKEKEDMADFLRGMPRKEDVYSELLNHIRQKMNHIEDWGKNNIDGDAFVSDPTPALQITNFAPLNPDHPQFLDSLQEKKRLASRDFLRNIHGPKYAALMIKTFGNPPAHETVKFGGMPVQSPPAKKDM